MKKIVFILISLLILNSGFKIDVDTNSKMKAIFIMNFTKLIEWPASYRGGNFVVGVIGDSPLYTELKKMAQTKKVANQSLEIKKFSTVEDIGKCHILFVSENKSQDITSVVEKVKANSTLIITSKQGLVDKGSGINFIVKNNRQKFELNKENVEKNKLKVSSNLEALAFTVK
jgi:hypothetical protein